MNNVPMWKTHRAELNPEPRKLVAVRLEKSLLDRAVAMAGYRQFTALLRVALTFYLDAVDEAKEDGND